MHLPLVHADPSPSDHDCARRIGDGWERHDQQRATTDTNTAAWLHAMSVPGVKRGIRCDVITPQK
eukprot:232024-Pelagomonas_calceolata.AAC.3